MEDIITYALVKPIHHSLENEILSVHDDDGGVCSRVRCKVLRISKPVTLKKYERTGLLNI